METTTTIFLLMEDFTKYSEQLLTQSMFLQTDLPDKITPLLITKRTEALFGVATFEGFILDGGKDLVNADDESIRKIEFVGDSYFTGFGIEGDSPDCVFSRETENSYLSFGPQLARKLNADYSIVAISGVGVTKNYGDSLRTSEYPLPYYYDRTCMNDSLLWDFSQWQPDAVVVRLGRNDYWQKPHPKREMFRSSISEIYWRNKNALSQSSDICSVFSFQKRSALRLY